MTFNRIRAKIYKWLTTSPTRNDYCRQRYDNDRKFDDERLLIKERVYRKKISKKIENGYNDGVFLILRNDFYNPVQICHDINKEHKYIHTEYMGHALFGQCWRIQWSYRVY